MIGVNCESGKGLDDRVMRSAPTSFFQLTQVIPLNHAALISSLLGLDPVWQGRKTLDLA